MKECLVCHRHSVRQVVDFGQLPICHHFFDGGQPEETHPVALGQCESCGLVHMMEPIPPARLVPRFDWITYNEPEAHLDAMVETLCGLPGISAESVIAGITYKEDTTLRRFRERGYSRTWRAETRSDLEITDPKAGIETAQSRIQPALARQLQEKHGAPDLVIVRHMLEHTHETSKFLECFRQLVKPTGYVVFEVPDCERAFDLFDYTTLWEDHSLYFVEPTFLLTLQRHGFSVVRFERYRAAYENCLVAVVRPLATFPPLSPPQTGVETQQRRVLDFANGFEKRRNALRSLLVGWRQRGKIAIFGAGHQSAMFINLMGVADLIEFVVDDHPRKCGLRMPGSRLPVVGSEALARGNIILCLSSLGAESEGKVVRKHDAFVKQGGTFASIFPITRDSLVNFVAGPDGVA